MTAALGIAGGCQRGKKAAPAASFGEDWRQEEDELYQFPQILGGGGQATLSKLQLRIAVDLMS
jgi:hypothetical protein